MSTNTERLLYLESELDEAVVDLNRGRYMSRVSTACVCISVLILGGDWALEKEVTTFPAIFAGISATLAAVFFALGKRQDYLAGDRADWVKSEVDKV
jgi:hypothetical protein